MRALFFTLPLTLPSIPVLVRIRDTDTDTTTAHRSTALGSALLAGSAIRLHGWDISRPETLAEVNTKGNLEFAPSMPEEARERRWQGWKRAIERSKGWEEGVDE